MKRKIAVSSCVAVFVTCALSGCVFPERGDGGDDRGRRGEDSKRGHDERRGGGDRGRDEHDHDSRR